jgi:uncharacterized membrane protein YgdD (TMEM256/DUF423 family)
MGHRPRIMLAIAAAALCVATILGAYAAHGLDTVLDADGLETFKTGVAYQFYHGLGLFGVEILRERYASVRAFAVASWLLLAGIVLFCGSLYIVAWGTAPFFGLLAPIGGLCFIAAWLAAGYGALTRP